MKNNNYIYLDWAAGAPIRTEIAKLMGKIHKSFGNTGSLHSVGVKAQNDYRDASKKIARFLECKNSEVFFTSGSTESNNLAILGSVAHLMNAKNPIHLITSQSEHSSVFGVFKYLEKQGAKVTYLPSNKKGQVRISDLQEALQKNTVLVSIIASNNETGAVNPIGKISKIVKNFNPKIKVHTDATQYAAWNKFNAAKLGANLISFNAAKMGGPHGIGVLFAKDRNLEPIMYGGEQQLGIRPGTENVAGAILMAETLNLAWENLDKIVPKVTQLKDLLAEKLLAGYEGSFVNNPKNGQPNILNITFPKVRGTDLVYALDAAGIGVSTGSACSEKTDNKGKRILASLGLSQKDQLSTIRLSLGWTTTKQEIIKAGKIIVKIAKNMQKQSEKLDKLDKIGEKIARRYV